MPEELEKLLEAAKEHKLSDAEREEQRRSFAFGTANIENVRVTRVMVDEEAEALEENSST